METARKVDAAPAAGQDDPDAWMTVPEVARELGRAENTIRTLALQGELEFKNIAKYVLISRASVARYKEAHPSPAKVARPARRKSGR